MAENFPNVKETGIKVQEAQRIQNTKKPKQIYTKTYYNKNGKI